jgi:L-ascorbate metabolism protein UlaG (beta-lactamase superfamily)
MKIKWYGHAAFMITSKAGTKIIIDPYESGAFGGALSYGAIKDEADIVLTSHQHDDHNYVRDIKGQFTLVENAGSYDLKGLHLRAIPSFHDASKGSERGANLIFVIETDDLKVVHLGDLGHLLDTETIGRIGKVDVLLLPVGGFYTIDPHEATLTMETLKPTVTIPMHYRTPKCEFPISVLDDFTAGKKAVVKFDSSEIEVDQQSLPGTPQIFVLRHAL